MPQHINRLTECLKKENAYDNITISFIESIAATIMGVKPASLVNVRAELCIRLFIEYSQENQEMGIVIIRDRPTKKQVLVYHKKSLSKVLLDKEKAQYLEELGYPVSHSLEEVISVLAKKLRSASFPHELGVFVGYPLKDVRGFIGENILPYQKTKGWKMYGDIEPSERIFRQFECAKLFVRRIILQEQENRLVRSIIK